MTYDNCHNIFNKNLKISTIDFLENTIRDIANTSKYISATGDKWTFSLNKKYGKLDSF